MADPYEDILDDETLAPLKRNHACLQCKKRKVKCDAIRPTCSPCMRSHAHAIRSAHRNKSKPPPLVCSYAEGEDEDDIMVHEMERKRVSSSATGAKRMAVGDRGLTREKDRRVDEERDTLKARIAELEARIATLTTKDTFGDQDGFMMTDPFNDANGGDWGAAAFNGMEGNLPAIESSEQIPDVSSFLLVPLNWPKNLPPPALLQHLVESFFQNEPQIPRMIHRATFLARLRLPPTHDDFPFHGLLHAICALASCHTAFQTNMTPEDLDERTKRHIQMGLDLESSEDFCLAQCEAAERCIRHGTVSCMMGSGYFVFDLVRTYVLLTVCYMGKGMPLRAWMCAGTPGRLIKALEISNRNQRKSDKPAFMPECTSDREREERYATVWMSYLVDSCFAINSAWAQTLELTDIHVPLPCGAAEFFQEFDTGHIKANPQTAHDIDIFVTHPIPDPFVLVLKSSFLLGKSAKWIRTWQQRVMTPGDEQAGLDWPSFAGLQAEIEAFQFSLPMCFRNLYKMADSGDLSMFNADLMSIHVFPNLAILLMYEQFVDWKGPDSPVHRALQKSFEAIVGFIHLIPSQMDIGHIVTPNLAFSIFSVGRVINRFIIRANGAEQYAQAMRWHTDLEAIISLLRRYGTKHPVGTQLLEYLSIYQRLFLDGRLHLENQCMGKAPAQVTAEPTPPSAAESEACDFSSSLSGLGSTNDNSPAVPSMGQTPESVDQVESGIHSHGAHSGGSVGKCPMLSGSIATDPSPPSITTPLQYQTQQDANLAFLAQNSGFDPSMDPNLASLMMGSNGDSKTPDEYIHELLAGVGGDHATWNTTYNG